MGTGDLGPGVRAQWKNARSPMCPPTSFTRRGTPGRKEEGGLVLRRPPAQPELQRRATFSVAPARAAMPPAGGGARPAVALALFRGNPCALKCQSRNEDKRDTVLRATLEEETFTTTWGLEKVKQLPGATR